ncbi:MAG: Wadjet anti-phage system protein JetD domain-containing protein [Pseudomonadota bacterium]|nr:Wadjet anti-phage system protein JetD domain-containing protein [Pseudomonadota bacterium]
MKSPTDLALRLRKQWRRNSIRSERLLNPDVWPVRLAIGKPAPGDFSNETNAVQRHVEQWRRMSVGEVVWETVRYRAGSTPVTIPVAWVLRSPSQWIAATGSDEIKNEYRQLEWLIEGVDELFHPLFVGRQSLWLDKDIDEVIAVAKLTMQLEPGCAAGRPFRLLSEYGVDTKFIERNISLITRLLDERFGNEPSRLGLTTFLDALDEGDHWILVVPLETDILPFKRLRLTTAELRETDLPCDRVLVVENEQCVHLLPELPDTIAILGAGLDLSWLAASSLSGKSIAYWGDMDTWGMLMLGRARQHNPEIYPLLMTRELFERYAPGSAVKEPKIAQPSAPEFLLDEEADFYRHLLSQERGRLEQEYLPRYEVTNALAMWMDRSRA